ncbi:MAG: hypothetical protein GTO60_16550 [Gammaproteobacteria bacterium]|nr:hypothetical protein [Gammaproteobacteria bacterium]
MTFYTNRDDMVSVDTEENYIKRHVGVFTIRELWTTLNAEADSSVKIVHHGMWMLLDGEGCPIRTYYLSPLTPTGESGTMGE